jgi:3-oxoacyl-[acyl-carrier-protein] synthase-3
MAASASRLALQRAGVAASEVDFIIFATITPDYYFPGGGVMLQRELEMHGIGALDIRNQCSAFVYAVSIADQFIRSGMYRTILVAGSEIQSSLMDKTTEGRNLAVIFGDGAGAVVMQATEDKNRSVLSTHLHADGRYAEELIAKVRTQPGRRQQRWISPKCWRIKTLKCL